MWNDWDTPGKPYKAIDVMIILKPLKKFVEPKNELLTPEENVRIKFYETSWASYFKSFLMSAKKSI